MGDKPYRLLFASLAYEDLGNIDSYIVNTLGNIPAADRLMLKLNKFIDQLKVFPYIGTKVGVEYLASVGYRKLVVDNYLVFYLVNDEKRTVIVMRVIHGSREYQNLL